MTKAPFRDSVRSVGILGAGTAGYLAALALRRHHPRLDVDVIASRAIPPIGVGESTIQQIVGFLHDDLGLDVGEFYRAVRPTWKLGIRFEWGLPAPHRFHFPFERIHHDAAHTEGWDVRTGSRRSLHMELGTTPLVRLAEEGDGGDGRLLPPPEGSYAYHLENRSLLRYLQAEVERAGASLVEARVVDVERSASGRVEALLGEDGRRFRHDLYLDCSGFSSVLLGDALGVPFVDFGASLFTDRALVATVPREGEIPPYTTATTLPAGWMWTIPMRDEDHLGYVFSSSHRTPDEAAAEMEAATGVEPEPQLLRFPSGRHARSWEGNVVGLGNAYAFVEPLESTALHLVRVAIRALVEALGRAAAPEAVRADFNRDLTTRWDFLRGFLALHYRFNKRLDTPFWRACRADVDLAGMAPLVEHFHTRGPLSLADRETKEGFGSLWEAGLFGTSSIDLLLLGQGERPPEGSVSPDPERLRRYRGEHAVWARLAAMGVPHREALELVERRPELAWATRPAPGTYAAAGGQA